MGGIIEGLLPHSRDDSMAQASEGYDRASQDVLRKYADIFKQQQDYLNPFFNAGTGALNNLVNFRQNFQTDPGYEFRLNQGLQSLDRSAAARGGLQSGAALKAAQQYGQNLASNEYNNAFNRQLGLAGLGAQSANKLGNYAGMYGQNYGNTLLGKAENQGNALIAGQNAKNQGYSDLFGLGGKILGGFF